MIWIFNFKMFLLKNSDSFVIQLYSLQIQISSLDRSIAKRLKNEIDDGPQLAIHRNMRYI